jgi:hypothetical protein
MKQTQIEPHARRCGAKTRTGGTPCKNWGMRNGRCRMHGGASTGPRTPQGKIRAAHWKSGNFCKEAREQRREVRQFFREARELLNQLRNNSRS